MSGQHRRNIEDPAIALGNVAQGIITTAGFATSVWLLLSNYHAPNHGLYFLYTMIAAAGPLLALFFGRTVKGWISAYETTPRAETGLGFFGERVPGQTHEVDSIHGLRS